MANITSDQIRDISIKTVEGFLNSKVPLSEGLAKQASAMQLNADQIQRAVEATNSIAYLKVLSLSDDRTVEFPLCKYAEVMSVVATPDLTKAASYRDTYLAPVISMEKTASAVEETNEMSKGEQYYYMTKIAAITQRKLENLNDRADTIVPDLIKTAQVVANDKHGLEKLATVATGPEFNFASALVYDEVKPYADTGIFKEAELKQVSHLICLIKEAKELRETIAKTKDELYRTDLVKEAFLRGVSSVVGNTIGSVVSAPIKMVGKAMGKSVTRGGNFVANKVRGAMGKPLVDAGVKGIGGLGLAIAGASMATDAGMYTPGRDKTTGRSNDVWTTLQKEPGN